MPKEFVELRILPAFAIARLGSSPSPMDNYEFEYPDPVGFRRIVGAPTVLVDPVSGELSLKEAPFAVRFRDEASRIRPICPFMELWAREAGGEDIVPLTTSLLDECGLQPSDVRWQVEVGNIKAYRRTSDPNDQIHADTGAFSDHQPKNLMGTCKNFVEGARLPFGSVQYIAPNEAFPEIRLRFSPAHGLVYGTASEKPDPNVHAVVYDSQKGKWKGYYDAGGTGIDARLVTNPGNVYAGYQDDTPAQNWISRGYLDDECDGIVTASLGGLSAYARIAAGPPNFAPDSLPIRTIADELEQALAGPDLNAPATETELDDVREIVRRALETVRLTNTTVMNTPSKGMARMDNLDVARALEPIFDPTLVDSAALRARHEHVLLSLESGTLVWFASVLREYEQVGNLTTAGRHKMPAMMRGADGRYLALTRRQLDKVRASAKMILQAPGQEDKS
jgi:hypothetical protein